MKKLFTSLFVLLLTIGFNSSIYAQIYEQDNPNESCTSIMVGKKASVDGSVITCHTCDGGYRTWLSVEPRKKNEQGAKASVYKGRMHTETPKDQTGMELIGEIDDVAETYAFLNVAYPCLNEKQLAMGETTITGRKELVNAKGMFYIEELQRIALQRCATAREAIRLIGQLVKQYGYADEGECLTIADKNEVWQFEIFGEGPDNIGGVWAAIRIPDDHVGVSANIPRIGELNLKDSNSCMASDNVFDVAKRMGFWDGKEPFKFWNAYNGKKPFAIRDYFILNALAPSLGLSYEADELPFTVKPDKKVSVQEVFALYRQTYEGTRFDNAQRIRMTKKREGSDEVDTVLSPYANPWLTVDMANTLNTIKPGTVERMRLVAVPQCAYSQIIQLRSWLPDEVGGVAYFSFDNPAQSPRIPIYSGALSVPQSFGICGQHRYREDAAIWTFRRANRLAAVKFGETRKLIEEGVAHFESKLFTEQAFVEQTAQQLMKEKGVEAAKQYLTDYTNNFAGAALQHWKELGDQLFFMYRRGI